MSTTPAGPPAATFAGFDAVARQIESRMPSARETYIPFPKNDFIAAYAIAAEAPHPNARSYMYLDSAANVLRFAPFAAAPTAPATPRL